MAEIREFIPRVVQVVEVQHLRGPDGDKRQVRGYYDPTSGKLLAEFDPQPWGVQAARGVIESSLRDFGAVRDAARDVRAALDTLDPDEPLDPGVLAQLHRELSAVGDAAVAATERLQATNKVLNGGAK